jgi:uncharacterized protein YyaL (SSP411 family)
MENAFQLKEAALSYNRLAGETSPYLLQHKDNPVHWWPWGEAAFAEAKRLNKPVLLSVGYAACHWCHVMAHESFEDDEIAGLMNALFVNIKVDREERPDVDALYMAALHELGEQGGWPLTMFLTPEGEPFWGGTYFPKTQAYGRASFPHVLREIARIHRDEGEKVSNNVTALKAALQPAKGAPSSETMTEGMLAEFAGRLAQAIDPVNGGLAGTPKFPNCVIFGYLWKLGLRNGLEACVAGTERSLVHMCQGGIYDHLGGGFARYAVDARWLVPHFEKMLYDNALLIDLMTEVWRETRNPLFHMRVRESAEWLLREMIAPDGGFASSYDADSEGEEGRFYVWSHAEILGLLGAEDGAFFAAAYDVTPDGNWEHTNILNRLHDLALPLPEDEQRLARLRSKLFEVRAKRVPPGWDDKVLADWNGLAIAALVHAGDTFQEPRWLHAGLDAYRFVKERMQRNGRLLHSYRDGKAHTPGVASDYANMIAGALRIYQVTGDKAVLDDAKAWTEVMNRHYSSEQGAYHLSADDTSDIIIRMTSARDDAVPNANAVMLSNLSALHLITGDMDYEERAEALQAALLGDALRVPTLHTGFLSGLLDVLVPQHVVLMRGNGEEQVREALRGLSLPGAVVECLAPDRSASTASPAYGKQAVGGNATAYICIGPQCSAPVTGAAEIVAALRAHRPGNAGAAAS